MASEAITTHELVSFDGTRLSFTVEGEGPLDFLLCDGIGCAGFVWRYLKPALRERGRIIHLHMRGHGRSEPPKDPANVEIHQLADDWRVVLAAVGRNPAVVLGHSMGVQVALELWRRHPQNVDALILMCGSFQNPVSTFHDDSSMERILPLLRVASRMGGRALQKVWRRLLKLPIAFHVARMTEIHPDLTRREDFNEYLEDLSQIDPALFFRMLTGAGRHSADKYLEKIDVPTLIIGAEFDQFTPGRLSEEMADRIPDAKLLVVEDGTHTAPIEQPSLINAHALHFIDGLTI